MSTEICILCNQESTPWANYLDGHICQDCYAIKREVEERVDRVAHSMALEGQNIDPFSLNVQKYNSIMWEINRKINENNKWINVKDRLPECNQEVLTSDGENIQIGRYEDFSLINVPNELWSSETGKIEVTHWMPLPLPPPHD